jgi:regulator of protease activity HflC (stomatin/prohibitin superfamily)
LTGNKLCCIIKEVLSIRTAALQFTGEMKMSNTLEMNNKFALEKKAFLKGLIIIGVSIIIASVLIWIAGIVGGVIGIIVAIIGIIMAPTIAFVVLYFVWAPNDVFGTFPEEGYATAIVRGQKFKRLFMEMEGFGFEDNWDVVEEFLTTYKQFEILGMVLFIWPFDRLLVYKQRWIKYSEKGSPIDVEEVLRGALLKSYVYFIGLMGAEDSRLMSVDVGMSVEMKIVNPYKALFRIQNWYRAVANFIQGELRNEIRKHDYNELISGKDPNSVSLDQIFQVRIESFIKKIEEDYGIRIMKIKIVQIAPSDEELKRASTKKAVAQFDSDAIRINADAQSYKRASETIGSVMEMLSKRTGLTVEQIQEQIRSDPVEFDRKYGSILREAGELVNRQIAADINKYIKIETSGGSGGSNNLLELIAAFQLMAAGGQGGQQSSQKSASTDNKKNKKSSPSEDSEELKNTFKDLGLD